MACRWESCDDSNRLQWRADGKVVMTVTDYSGVQIRKIGNSNRLQWQADGKVVITVADYNGVHMGKSL